MCSCATGVLGEDDRSCKDSSEYLLFTTRTEIRSLSLNPDNNAPPFETVSKLVNVVGIDFDYKDKELVFTQIKPNVKIATVSSSKPSVEGMKTILNKGINPEGVAYDWIAKKIYWTDSQNHSIYAMNRDGSAIVNIINVERPRALVLDPCRG